MFSADEVRTRFRSIFKTAPMVIRAPGRINLIGEHTDYNDGFVMPAAVDKEIFFGISDSADGKSVLYSLNYDERFEVDFDNLRPVDSPRWANYVLGILFQFRERGYPVKPFYCAFGGNVPLGAGMSSSAAMECGFAVALDELNALRVPKLDMVHMAQWAEHHFVGVKCGIMDQFASMMGKKDHVMVLDCRSLTHEYAPLDLKEYQIVLCDTKVKHSLVDSQYNTRRKECESGVKTLQRYFPEVKSLRDVTIGMLEEHKSELTGKVYQRCRYVVREIARVQEASADLKAGNLKAFGAKMFETHEELSHLYEVSCEELDFLVAEARRFNAVLGARMMGGGFGGCTINLVRRADVEDFIGAVGDRYRSAFKIEMAVYQVNVVDGTARVA